ncbi:hypothetical protein PLESTB_001613100 [Pleodorina starrii]|uniref:Uncharacterized protein n=1 Tax=Pleodorina starrii TaxID=330485 RepID=A0A9W6BY81_9CHLO|nr:hypothetical protein PLESTB_001613100 [Pleodorina starrii]GLC64177.1 hypothetical protein PLESTF_000132900 [Pleodorina starrii]
MMAKSEASMPMSRALTKLAVATDLGTAARPSTAAPAAAVAGGAGSGSSSGGGGGRKTALSTASGRSLLLKPCAARSVLASLPLPLTGLDHGNKASAVSATAAAAAQAPAAGAAGPGPPARSGSGSGSAVGGLTVTSGAPPAAAGTLVSSPSTPRLPPLPIHSPPPPQQAAATAAAAAAQQWTNTHPQHHPNQHFLPTSPPLPPCGMGHVSPSPAHGQGHGSEISKELRDAARNHPGLPASLLAQLHHPRRHGTAASAPVAGGAAAASAPPPPPQPCGGAAAAPPNVRPLSPRSRARMTASLVNGAQAVPPTPPQQQQQQLAAPPPAVMSGLSPEALAVLLAAPSQPPPTPGGLLVMRRAGPVAVGAGAALRPSTAQQGSGSAAGTGAAGPVASPGTPAAPSRPPVMPHITMPYKPGSIRLPTGGVPGLTAAVALGASGKTSSGPGSGGGSSSSSPVVPATAAAAASASELLRPWTSVGAASGALRPTTANPLTHSMPTDTSSALVVRVPRSVSETPHTMLPLGGMPPRNGSLSAGRVASAAKSGAGASAPGTAASAPGAAAGGGDASGGGGKVQDARQLTAQELRAVVAALAAARPEAAAMLLQRPATAASAASAGASSDPLGRPGSSAIRRPATSEAAAQGALWDSLYGNFPPGSTRSSSRASSRATTWGTLLSAGGVRDPSVYDDKWPRPSSGSSRPTSRGATGASAGAPGSAGSSSSSGGGGSSCGGSAASRRPAVSAWGATVRPLESIPEDTELHGGGEEALGATAAAAAGLDAVVPGPLRPLEPLDPDPELDVAWANIVASNQRPDTAATRAASSGLNVFSRPATGSLRIVRQAAPMVLVVEDITASTPEVLERELETLSLEELQALQAKLCAKET